MKNSTPKKMGRPPKQKIDHETLPEDDPRRLLVPDADQTLTPDLIEAAEEAYRQEVIPSPVTSDQPLQETSQQRKAGNVWIRQHLSGLFTANQVDAAVARVVGVELATIRRWKVALGWSKRLENTRTEEKAEEQIVLYLKNEKMENDAIDTVLRYIEHVKTLPPDQIMPGHVTTMMKLVDFAQKNKDRMRPADPMTTATGVSLTIQHD